MSQTIAICPADDIIEGEMKGATLPDGTRIALYHLHGTYYASDDTCTHENASLTDEGMMEGDQIICGWHFCGFDIASGAATASPCSEPLRTYPVKLVEGVVHVEL
jgi:p-cumate 2,3-dioxygenase ferredoxin subunit